MRAVVQLATAERSSRLLGHVGQSQSVEFHSLEACAEGAMHALGTKLGVSRVLVPGLCINA